MYSESKVEGDCRDYARDRDCFLLKLASAFFVGIPDRMIIGPNKTSFFIEFKKVGKKPSKRQKFVHKLFRDLGFPVYVIDEYKNFKEILDAELQKAEAQVSRKS